MIPKKSLSRLATFLAVASLAAADFGPAPLSPANMPKRGEMWRGHARTGSLLSKAKRAQVRL